MNASSGPHSAMAIQRQRRLREKKERERRSSCTNSNDSIEHPSSRLLSSRAQSGKGILHIGMCCVVLGVFLIGSGILPNDIETFTSGAWQMELVAIGILVAVIGIFLIILNPIVNECKEYNRNKYDEKDVENGYSTTEHPAKDAQKKNDNETERHHITQIHPPVDHNVSTILKQNIETNLERIVEENDSEGESIEHTNIRKTSSNISSTSPSSNLPTTKHSIMHEREDSFHSRQY